MIQTLWKIVWQFLKELTIHVAYDLAIPRRGVLPKRKQSVCSHKILYTTVYSRLIHNYPKLETTQISIDRRMEARFLIIP